MKPEASAATGAGPTAPPSSDTTGSGTAASAAPGSAAGAGQAPSLVQLLRSLWAEARLAVQARLHLVTLELRQAGIAAAQIVLLATVAGLLLCSAWAALLVALFLGLQAAGLHWAVAIAIVVAANLGAAWLAWKKAQTLTIHFTFPATLRLLKDDRPPPA